MRAGMSVAGRLARRRAAAEPQPVEGDVMKLASIVVAATAVFAALPAFAEGCEKPAIVTGGQVAMYSHATQARNDPQPIRAVVTGRGMNIRPAAGSTTTAPNRVASARCLGCCKTSSGREALSATGGMKNCAHLCGCSRA
jgi:hypothetical protein